MGVLWKINWGGVSYKALYREPKLYYVLHNIQAINGNVYDYIWDEDKEAFLNEFNGVIYYVKSTYETFGCSTPFDVPTVNKEITKAFLYPITDIYSYEYAKEEDYSPYDKLYNKLFFNELYNQYPYWLYMMLMFSGFQGFTNSNASAQIKDETGKILVEWKYSVDEQKIIETRY